MSQSNESNPLYLLLDSLDETISLDFTDKNNANIINMKENMRNRCKKPRIAENLKEAALNLLENEQMSVTECAKLLRINRTTLSKIIKRYNQTGDLINQKAKGRSKVLTDQEGDELCELLDENCALSLKELRTYCEGKYGKIVSESTISRVLKAFHYSFKRTCLIPECRLSERTIELRFEYARSMHNELIRNPEKVFFLDEVGFNISMRSSYGWSGCGSRSNIRVGNLRSRNITVCAILSNKGYVKFEHKTGGFCGADFIQFLETVLQEFDKRNITNGILVMDNATIHKYHGIPQALLSSKGHRLVYLPPYSPFLNPIEESFSKWKHLVRHAAPKSEQELYQLIESTHALITEEDATNYYSHSLEYFPKCLSKENIEN